MKPSQEICAAHDASLAPTVTSSRTQNLPMGGPGGVAIAGEIGVTILRSVAQVEEHRAAWSQLLHHPNADIDLFLSEIQSRPQILRPHVILLQRDGEPDSILVGRLEIGKMGARFGYASLLTYHARTLTFIYGGLQNSKPAEYSATVLAREVMNSLRNREAEVAFFNHVRSDAPLCAALSRAAGRFGRDYFPITQVHRGMQVPATAEAFLGGLSPKVRRNQRWKKLLHDYPDAVRIECFSENSQLDLMCKDMESIAKKTYQRALGVGFADDQDSRRRMRLRAEKSWVRGYILYIEGIPAAFWLGTVCRGTFHSDSMGYDPAFSKYSPGMYLIVRVIEKLCDLKHEQRVSFIDFGLGDAEYKQILCDTEWQDTTTYVFAPTVRGVALNLIRTPVLLVDWAARIILERTHLAARVKKLWRDRRRASELRSTATECAATAQSSPQNVEKPDTVSAE